MVLRPYIYLLAQWRTTKLMERYFVYVSKYKTIIKRNNIAKKILFPKFSLNLFIYLKKKFNLFLHGCVHGSYVPDNMTVQQF